MPLSTLGSFEILAELGAGPRGVMYRARHLTLGRIVALKHLAATPRENSPEYTRLTAEVERVRVTASEHVAAVLTVQLADDRPLIEMEFLDESLQKRLKRGPLDPDEAIPLLRDMLAGLARLHGAGIIHANLKPSNVLQEAETGHWKLADGGMTHIEALSSPTLLASSVVYDAPEIVSRLTDANAQSDLYCVGMIGLEALLGDRLHEAFPGLGPSASPGRWMAWLRKMDEQAVPLRDLRPDLPDPLSPFFARLLAKSRASRYASAEEALDGLDMLSPASSPALPTILKPSTFEPPLAPSPSTTLTPTPTPAPASTQASQTSRPARPNAMLLVTGPGGFRQEFPLADRTLRIGRDVKNEIVLPDDSKGVSRLHAELSTELGKYVITDLDSQNGIWTGGRRKPTVALGPGVEVTIGGYTLKLMEPATTTTATAPAKAEAGAAAASTPASMAPSRREKAGFWPPKTVQHWAVLGVAAAIVLVSLVWLTLPKEPEPAPAQTTTQVTPDPPPSPPPPPPPEDPEAKAREVRQAAVTAARDLVEQRYFKEALAHINTLLAANPNDADGLALRDEAIKGLKDQERQTAQQNQATARQTPATGSARGGRKPPPGNRGQVAPPPVPVNSRETRLAQLYENAVKTTDVAGAVAAWSAVHSEDPTYRDTAARLTAARRAAYSSAMQDASRLEASSDLPGAQTALERALGYEPGSAEGNAAFKRVGARRREEGMKALQNAENYEIYKRNDLARREYQKAYDYLLPGDPNRQRAKDGLDRIGK
jgi:serine/threonine protein kinase